MDRQLGDELRKGADVHGLEKDIHFKTSTGIGEGLAKFVDWY